MIGKSCPCVVWWVINAVLFTVVLTLSFFSDVTAVIYTSSLVVLLPVDVAVIVMFSDFL